MVTSTIPCIHTESPLEVVYMKSVRSRTYNYDFDTETGYFERWGRTPNDDPFFSPLGAEIADIEISTICHGVKNKPCRYCYKSNCNNGVNMTLDTFKKVFNNLPPAILQIAFGIGDIDSNPDMFDIFEYCRDHGVIPNVTINGDRLTDSIIDRLVGVCGAVAVSNHNSEVCYNAVDRLTKAGLKQVNIHQVICEETLDETMNLICDCKIDQRLENLNAVVFLSLKPIGRGNNLTPLSYDNFSSIVRMAINYKISFGFDSCSCNKFISVIKDRYPQLIKYAEPCESTLFSIYINVYGEVYPCSFAETPEWYLGDAKLASIIDMWYGNKTKNFRFELMKHKRSCPIHEV